MDDPIPLDKWTILERSRIQRAVDMAVEMLADGYIKQTEVILKALSNRLAVDDSVLEFFHQHDQLDGECHVMHQ